MKLSELHQLIHALDKEEEDTVVQHFRNSGYGPDSLYRKLFEYLIQNPPPFDPDHFADFSNENGLNDGTLRNYCKRIYNEVRHFLLQLNAQKDQLLIIRRHLCMAKLLVQKELYAAAKTELKKAQQVENEVKHPSSRFEIETVMAHILYLEDHKKIGKPVNSHHEIAGQAAADFQRDATIYLAYQQLYRHDMRQKDEAIIKAREAIATQLDEIELPDDANLETKIYYISLKMRIAYDRNQRKDVHRWAEQLYLLFKENPSTRVEEQQAYLTTLDHYLSALNIRSLHQEMQLILQELEAVDAQEPYLQTKKVGSLLFYRLSLYCAKPAEVHLIDNEAVERIKATFEEHRTEINPSRSVSIRFLFAVLYLLRIDYANAESMLEDIPIQKTNKNRSDLQRDAMILRLAIQVDDELQSFSHVQSNIDSVNQRLHKWGGLEEYEAIALKYFGKLISAVPERRVRMEIEQEFLDELLEHAQQKNGHTGPGAETLKEWLKIKLSQA